MSYHIHMKVFDWSEEKNIWLQVNRNVSFEDFCIALAESKLLDIVVHPNKLRYPNQKMFIVEIDHYVYIVPFVENETAIFLKTIIPSRVATKKYLM